MVKKIILCFAVIAVALAVYFIFFNKTEADLVKQQFKYLSEYASKLPGEGGTTMLYKAKVVGNLFDEYCDLSTKDSILSGHYSREDISGKSLMFRKMLTSANITFHEITIESLDDKKAKVITTAKLSARDNNNSAIDQTRELEVTLLKKDGKWLFSDFQIATILKK